MFELNDKVMILSGGISGFPTVNLSGVQGRVVSPHPSTPDGWIAVWVDWSKTPYKDLPGLPNPINNTPEMIDLVDDGTRPAPHQPERKTAEEPAPAKPSPFRLI